MSAIPIFDRVKFAKVHALYASTPYAGERHAAHRKMELLAKAVGLTIEQAADIAGVSRGAFSKFVQERQSYSGP